jgi:hypothetical protein
LNSFGLLNPEVYSIHLQENGKILIGGSQQIDGISRDLFVIRLLNNGFPDEDFGSGGLVSYSITNNGLERVMGITTGEDEMIYITGHAATNGNSDIFIAALQENGYLNTSFGEEGIIKKSFSNGNDFSNDIKFIGRINC